MNKLSDLVFCIGSHDVLHPDGWLKLNFPKNANISCTILTDTHDIECKHIVNFKDAKKYFLLWMDNYPDWPTLTLMHQDFFDFKPCIEWLLKCTSREPILRVTVKTFKTGDFEWGWIFSVDILISPEDIPHYFLKFI